MGGDVPSPEGLLVQENCGDRWVSVITVLERAVMVVALKMGDHGRFLHQSSVEGFGGRVIHIFIDQQSDLVGKFEIVRGS